MTDGSIRPYLTTRGLVPENQESPVHFISLSSIPDELLYRRNHFAYPSVGSIPLSLQIAGEVHRPRLLDYDFIRSLPARSVSMVLECAGSKRSFFEPKVFGEQWGKGAVGQGVWRGTPLANLLQTAGIKPTAREVVAEGWDRGSRNDVPGIYPFARSIPIQKAMHPDTILAYEYNGQPLSLKHGFPFRFIVPHWYGMASVKWVRSLIVTEAPFRGPFQSIDYQYYPEKGSDQGKQPVALLNVNSSIQRPLNRSQLRKGKHVIQGFAWTGSGEIDRVELSFDGGDSWDRAQLGRSPFEPRTWARFSYVWEVSRAGEYTILSRAADTTGRVQPMAAFWNRKGYGYNAVDQVTVKIE